jgi:hypothetical protein
VLKTGRTAQFDTQKNQVVQESESGAIKVLTLTSNEVVWYEFAINRMPYSDRTVGALTIRGTNTLSSLIRSTMNYRETSMRMWAAGEAKIGAGTIVRYWSSTFKIENLRMLPTEVYGNGSQILRFRKDV